MDDKLIERLILRGQALVLDGHSEGSLMLEAAYRLWMVKGAINGGIDKDFCETFNITVLIDGVNNG